MGFKKITIFLVLGILLGFGMYYVTASSTRVGFLIIDHGVVEVNSGNGWHTAKDSMKLSEGDAVRTIDGEATIVLYESALIQLGPNTEVSITTLSQKHISITQIAGDTWNSLSAVTGIGVFEVETPSTVATVRGTEFGINEEEIIVGEGRVDATMDGTEYQIRAGRVVHKVDGLFQEETMNPAQREMTIQKLHKTIKKMQRLRNDEFQKKRFLLKILEKQFGIGEGKAKAYLERADQGEFDLEEVEAKSPVTMKAATKVKRMTQHIIDQHNAIAALEREE